MTNSLETVIGVELIRSSWKILVFINRMYIHARVLQTVFVTPAIMPNNEKILYK